MRKILRRMARHNMERMGFVHINKKSTYSYNSQVRVGKSFFAQNWRDYIHVEEN